MKRRQGEREDEGNIDQIQMLDGWTRNFVSLLISFDPQLPLQSFEPPFPWNFDDEIPFLMKEKRKEGGDDEMREFTVVT